MVLPAPVVTHSATAVISSCARTVMTEKHSDLILEHLQVHAFDSSHLHRASQRMNRTVQNTQDHSLLAPTVRIKNNASSSNNEKYHHNNSPAQHTPLCHRTKSSSSSPQSILLLWCAQTASQAQYETGPDRTFLDATHVRALVSVRGPESEKGGCDGDGVQF